MSTSAKVQWSIAAVALLLFGGGMWWLLTHRKEAAVPEAPLPAPKVLALKVKGADGSRGVADGATVKVGETLDFEIEVPDLCFAYVFKREGDKVALEWGAQPSDEVWVKGVYAPSWHEGSDGMRFAAPGDTTLHVVVAPKPIADAEKWDAAAVSEPGSRCPRCAGASAHFKVVAADGSESALR